MKKKKIGRNDPCPCGSGKKYKKCCLDKLPACAMEPYILTKKQFIEEKTSNKIIFEEKSDLGSDAVTDFGNWNDMSNLPKILHKPSIDNVHLLHELIHLEKFFVDQYSIIACNDRRLHKTISIFKNIPEDYVAHKIINDEYSLNPIKKSWFAGKDDLTLSHEQVAANLAQYDAFCKFCPEYNDNFNTFYEDCRRENETSFIMADKTIKALESMDYKDKNSYNQSTGEIIKIFAPRNYNRSIYLSYFSKDKNGKWCWNP